MFCREPFELIKSRLYTFKNSGLYCFGIFLKVSRVSTVHKKIQTLGLVGFSLSKIKQTCERRLSHVASSSSARLDVSMYLFVASMDLWAEALSA